MRAVKRTCGGAAKGDIEVKRESTNGHFYNTRKEETLQDTVKSGKKKKKNNPKPISSDRNFSRTNTLKGSNNTNKKQKQW